MRYVIVEYDQQVLFVRIGRGRNTASTAPLAVAERHETVYDSYSKNKQVSDNTAVDDIKQEMTDRVARF